MCQNHIFQVTKTRNFEKPKKKKKKKKTQRLTPPPKKKTTTGLDVVFRMG
jgi:hypothetical protein